MAYLTHLPFLILLSLEQDYSVTYIKSFDIFISATYFYLLNSRRAFVEAGTDCAGHDLKWNCVTVLVSPVLVFFKYTDLTR